MAPAVPSFDELPAVTGPGGEKMPQGCTWGLWDADGQKDVFGTLNLLTPEVVRSAYGEARDGVSISLNWHLAGFGKPTGGYRKALEHKPVDLAAVFGMSGWDDEVSFNTQVSSQWDSLIHYCHQGTGLAYNGASLSVEGLEQGFNKHDTARRYPTLQHWHARGGLVARGVLLDYKRWADKTGKEWNPAAGGVMSVAYLEACAKDQGVEFRTGDVLILRTGYVEAIDGLGEMEQLGSMMNGLCGIESSEAAARWIWNNHFSAVASDTVSFEALPPATSAAGVQHLVLHEYLLSMFGTSIGELWDLKALSEHCAKTGRYSFLLTSAPLNIGGLAASPPNALALF